MTADHDAIRAEALYMIGDFDACDLPGSAALVRHLLADRDALAAEVERLTEEADERQTVIKKLAGEVGKLKAKCRNLGEDLEAHKAVLNDPGEWEKHQAAEVARLTEERSALLGITAELIIDADAARAEVERLTWENAERRKDADVAVTQAAQYSAWLAAARARVAELEKDRLMILGDLIAANNARDAARAQVADLEAELAEARAYGAAVDPPRHRIVPHCSTCGKPWGDGHDDCLHLGDDIAAVRITPPDERNPVSGLIGLFATQHTDLARRAKNIARGRCGNAYVFTPNLTAICHLGPDHDGSHSDGHGEWSES